MDEELKQRIEAFRDELMVATNEVDAALESGEERRELAAGDQVRALVARWADLVDELDDDERTRLERGLGRRVTDLRRQAADLSRRDSGAKAELAKDAGSVPFLLSRTPGKSIVPQRAAPTRDAPKFSVGSEVDAWCGKCKEMRTHNIVAMVGGEPKQVICQVCNSRHNFRTDAPMRGSAGGAATPSAGGSAPARRGGEDKEAQKKQEARRVLQKELADAVEPRPFDPHGRYKAGEIITHPEHGRGKIENVLKGSLLVRFVEGLRPLNLR